MAVNNINGETEIQIFLVKTIENIFGGNPNDFRSEPLINPLYYGFMSIETWSSLWNWIFSSLNKVFT